MVTLQHRHTFGLSASAAELYELRDKAELTQLQQRYIGHLPAPFWLMGEGSNTVFSCDYAGLVVVNKLKGIDIEETDIAWRIKVASGENWHCLVSLLVQKGIPGLENLALIPGSVGAAPVQNIGAYGVEIAEFIRQVEVYDLQQDRVFWLAAADCQFGYRDSIFKRPEYAHWLILSVELQLPKQWQARLNYPDLQHLPASASATDIYHSVIAVRNNKLPNPTTLANAGSFFKNPEVPVTQFTELQQQFPDIRGYPLSNGMVKLAAGWLIEHAGLKQVQEGDIGVHQQQALVLVNYGNGTGPQLISLVEKIRLTIKQMYGVVLEPEVRVLGATGLLTW